MMNMPPRISIVNARVVAPGGRFSSTGPSDVHVADGKLVAVGAAPSGFVADRVIDGRGCLLLPGVVDLAARLREPGFEYKATLESEMQAALAGGVTALACPPDTDPVLDEPGLVEMLKHRARGIDGARLYPVGALTVGLKGETITEMAELVEAGCIGFSHALAPIADTQILTARCSMRAPLATASGCIRKTLSWHVVAWRMPGPMPVVWAFPVCR